MPYWLTDVVDFVRCTWSDRSTAGCGPMTYKEGIVSTPIFDVVT